MDWFDYDLGLEGSTEFFPKENGTLLLSPCLEVYAQSLNYQLRSLGIKFLLKEVPWGTEWLAALEYYV